MLRTSFYLSPQSLGVERDCDRLCGGVLALSAFNEPQSRYESSPKAHSLRRYIVDAIQLYAVSL